MIYVIMGKSATGKDTIFDKLVNNRELGLTRIVPYTTRPIRNGELEGHQYHFVDEQEMDRLDREGLIVEHRQYDTVHGIWHYFTVDDEKMRHLDTSYVTIATLEAYEKLRAYYGEKLVVPIYIEVDDYHRLGRAIKRENRQSEPNFKEVCRRYLADEEDFSEAKLEAAGIDRRYKNDNISECVNNICNDIKNIRYTTLNVLY